MCAFLFFCCCSKSLSVQFYIYINSFISKCQWNVLTGPLVPVQFNDVKKIYANGFMGNGNNRERPAG